MFRLHGLQSADEIFDLCMTAQLSKCPLCRQEACRCPAQGHRVVLVVRHSAGDSAHHRIRALDDVGGGQATRQLALHPEFADREHFIEPFKHTGRRIGVLGLQLFGQALELALALDRVELEGPRHDPVRLLRLVLGPSDRLGRQHQELLEGLTQEPPRQIVDGQLRAPEHLEHRQRRLRVGNQRLRFKNAPALG